MFHMRLMFSWLRKFKWSAGIWYRVVWQVGTSVSDEHTASIFGAKYWRYVTEKCWYRLPGHTLTSKKDYNIWFRLCYNAIHIAICVQPWHRRRYRVSVFSITTNLKKERTYPLDHYTWHFQWDKYFSISYIKMSYATNDRYECHFAVVSSLPHCIRITRNTISMQYYYLASPSFTYIPTVIQTKDGLAARVSGTRSYTHITHTHFPQAKHWIK